MQKCIDIFSSNVKYFLSVLVCHLRFVIGITGLLLSLIQFLQFYYSRNIFLEIYTLPLFTITEYLFLWPLVLNLNFHRLVFPPAYLIFLLKFSQALWCQLLFIFYFLFHVVIFFFFTSLNLFNFVGYLKTHAFASLCNQFRISVSVFLVLFLSQLFTHAASKPLLLFNLFS